MPAVVYIICPDDNSPSGGIMKLYELAQTLNIHGIESYIIHESDDFRVTWFEHAVTVKDLKSTVIKNHDILVIPEIWAERTLTLFPGIRKIIFNQNAFNTFLPFQGNAEKARNVYLHRDIIQVIVVSKHDLEALNWLFPGVRVRRIWLGINNHLFYFNPDKKKQITLMSRRSKGDFPFVDQLLKAKGDLNGFSIKIIDNIPIRDCAAVLRESAIFLSFSHKEGFGLPPAEAMACGCIVIGYHGQGGKEFFRKNLTYPVEESDYFNYAKQVARVIRQFEVDPSKMLKMGKQASAFIYKQYSVKKQSQSILEIISPFV